ncbi:MAG: ribosome-associated translation inhibitor RaiA [Rhodospirillales bacterium]|nr:ribosome-associated translation inhibitor RaiA [Rhodospirillales bacterium]
MEILVTGKHLDVGDALRAHVETNLDATVTKYFIRAVDASVTISREPNGFRAGISAHPGRGLLVQGGATAADPYAAFDSALERIAKQLRRYKRRLRDHHKGRRHDDTLPAQQYIIAAESEDEELKEATQTPIIAEMPTDIPTLSVGEAVMRMDLGDLPMVMFRNRAGGVFNVVYRRPDGNIGWVDPSGSNKVKG